MLEVLRTSTHWGRMWKHFVESRNVSDLLLLLKQVGVHHFTISFYGFSLLRLQPRVLVDVSRINLSTTILGYNIASPIMIAPTAMHQLAHPEGLCPLGWVVAWVSSVTLIPSVVLCVSGELATARAAAACNTIMVLDNLIFRPYFLFKFLHVEAVFAVGIILYVHLYCGGGRFQLQRHSVLAVICIYPSKLSVI